MNICFFLRTRRGRTSQVSHEIEEINYELKYAYRHILFLLSTHTAAVPRVTVTRYSPIKQAQAQAHTPMQRHDYRRRTPMQHPFAGIAFEPLA